MAQEFKVGDRVRIIGNMWYTGQYKDCGNTTKKPVEYSGVITHIRVKHVLVKTDFGDGPIGRPWKYNLVEGKYVKKQGSCPHWDLEIAEAA